MLLYGPMFTNGKNVRNIQSSFSLKTRSFPGKSFSCHKSTGAKQSAYLQHEKINFPLYMYVVIRLFKIQHDISVAGRNASPGVS